MARKNSVSSNEAVNGDTEFVKPSPLVVAPFLEVYGYMAIDATTWKVKPSCESLPKERGTVPTASTPVLEIGVIGHEEQMGHTIYIMQCTLAVRGITALHWKTGKRLGQVRADLHDQIKEELGPDVYAREFAETPFAHKGGLPGTTSRLREWFVALSKLIIEGKTSPMVVAVTLLFLEVPEPDLETLRSRAAVEDEEQEVAEQVEAAKRQSQQPVRSPSFKQILVPGSASDGSNRGEAATTMTAVSRSRCSHRVFDAGSGQALRLR